MSDPETTPTPPTEQARPQQEPPPPTPALPDGATQTLELPTAATSSPNDTGRVPLASLPDNPSDLLPALGLQPGAHGPEALAAIDAQLVRVQEQIRVATKQRAEMLGAGRESELSLFDTDLAMLRRQRQALLDEQLRLQRELAPTEPEPVAPVTPPPIPTMRRPVRRAQGRPPLLIRMATLLLVLAGVAAIAIGGLVFLFDRLQPPPIEGIGGDGVAEGEAFPVLEGQTIEERGLAIYLSLNQDIVAQPAGDDPTPVTFRVEEGETAVTIAQRLEEAGLITNQEVFRRLLRYRGADQSLEAGVFELATTMTMDDIIVALQQGRLEEVAFTLVEGRRAEEMAAALEQSGLANAEEYMALVRDPSRFEYDFLQGLPEGSTLEGYLFPDTYSVIPAEANAESIIRLQLENWGRRVPAELRAAVTAQGLTLHQAVILASIVEREAVVAEERETIAGVYINRWQDGTVLNADPTIQYALGFQADTDTWWKRPLTREDLQMESPYNTYTIAGLPPGPIANPGLDSLRATIVAPDTEFYYFVSRNDGTHVFARTFEEHLANVAQYQSGE